MSGTRCWLFAYGPADAAAISNPQHLLPHLNLDWFYLGIVELYAKILQIMRNDFKDYARTFCQLCAPFSILYYT